MADQTLVPRNRPYGERQKMVDSRRQAGLALDPTPPAVASPVAAAGVSPSSGPAPSRPTPRTFDPLLETSPDMFPSAGTPASAVQSPVTMTAKDALNNVMATSRSGLMRSVAARLAQR